MATLEYDFRIVGLNAVSMAFASLERRAAEHNAKMSRMYGTAGRGGSVTGSTGGSTSRGTSSTNVRDFWQPNQQRRDAARVLREDINQHNTRSSLRGRLYNDEIRQEQRKEAAKTREVRRASQERERIYRSTYEQRRFRSRVGGAVGGAIGTVGKVAAGAAAVGAGMLIAAGLNAGKNTYRTASALAANVKQGDPDNKDSRESIMKGILGKAATVAEARGVKRSSVVEQMLAFFGPSGSLSGAKNMAGYNAAYAEAGNADPAVIGKLSGRAYATAINKGQSPAEAEETTKTIMGTFMTHAAQKSIELPDYAVDAPKVLASASRVGSKKDFARNVAFASYIAQSAMEGGATSSAEAATSLGRLVDDLTAHQAEIKKVTGNDPFEKNESGVSQLKGFEKILPSMFAATNGDVGKLMALGVGVRGNRALMGFRDAYVRGRDSVQGPGVNERQKVEAGAAEVAAELEKALLGGRSEADINADAAFRKESDPYEKFSTAVDKFVDSAVEPLTKAVENLNTWLKDNKPKIDKAIELTTDAVGTASVNPVTTVGILALGAGFLKFAGGFLRAKGAQLAARAVPAIAETAATVAEVAAPVAEVVAPVVAPVAETGGGLLAGLLGGGAAGGLATSLGLSGAIEAAIITGGAAGTTALGAIITAPIAAWSAAAYNAYKLFGDVKGYTTPEYNEKGQRTGGGADAPLLIKGAEQYGYNAEQAAASKSAAAGMRDAAAAAQVLATMLAGFPGFGPNRGETPSTPTASAGGRQ